MTDANGQKSVVDIRSSSTILRNALWFHDPKANLTSKIRDERNKLDTHAHTHARARKRETTFRRYTSWEQKHFAPIRIAGKIYLPSTGAANRAQESSVLVKGHHPATQIQFAAKAHSSIHTRGMVEGVGRIQSSGSACWRKRYKDARNRDRSEEKKGRVCARLLYSEAKNSSEKTQTAKFAESGPAGTPQNSRTSIDRLELCGKGGALNIACETRSPAFDGGRHVSRDLKVLNVDGITTSGFGNGGSSWVIHHLIFLRQP